MGPLLHQWPQIRFGTPDLRINQSRISMSQSLRIHQSLCQVHFPDLFSFVLQL